MRLSVFSSLVFITLAATGDVRAQTIVPGVTPASDVTALAENGLTLALETLPATITDIMARSGVPGIAVAVVQGGETVFIDGFGVRDMETGAPVTPETVFQIASISKSISATVGAVAVAKGIVSWDDTARRYLPDLELSDAYVTTHATIGDFFSHRTGLPMAVGDELEDLGFERDAIRARLAQVPLDAFRTSYHYANFGITIGAEAIAAASGMDWGTLADKTLFEPLGMNSTSFRHDDLTKRSNFARLHSFENGRFEALYQRDADAQAPAGGVSSNVLDMAIWMKALLAGQVPGVEDALFADALLPALQPQTVSGRSAGADGRSSTYGYGFNVGVTASGRPNMSHSGAFLLGAATHFQMIPSADIGIVVLTNGGPIGVPEAIAAHFLDVVQFGEASRDWFAAYNHVMSPLYAPVGDLVGVEPLATAEMARALADYAGVYTNPYFGTAHLVIEDDELVALLGPDEQRYPLARWSPDVFAMIPRHENGPAGSLSSVRFATEANAVSGFTITYLNENGLAVWTRQP